MADDYSQAAVAATEAAVLASAGTADWDSQRGLRLLQLYQFHPSLSRPNAVFAVLARAIMALPQTDFAACICLVPDKVAAAEPVSVAVQCDALLETADFAAFWRFVEPHRELFASIPDFFPAVSRFIIGVLELTYRRIPKAQMMSALHITEGDVAGIVTSKGWTMDGDNVVIPSSQPAQKKPQHAEQPVNLEQLSRVLSTLQQ